MTAINLLKEYPQSNRPIDDRDKIVDDNNRLVSRKFGYEY